MIQLRLSLGWSGSIFKARFQPSYSRPLQYYCRILECADIADMIKMQVRQYNCFDILRLKFDLAQGLGRRFKIGKLSARHGSAGGEPSVDEEDVRSRR